MGISLANLANDKGFGFFIRDGHQVCPSLELDLLLAVHVMFQNIAGCPGNFDGEV